MSAISKPRFHLFGEPRVTTRDGPVRLSPYQTYVLFLVFGHESAGLTRRELAWLMWEEDDTSRVRQRIRQLLHHLRKRIGFDAILAEGHDHLLGNAEALNSDLADLGAHVDAGRWLEAATLMRPGFGAGFSATPSETFDDWLQGRELRLRRDVREGASMSWDEARRAEDWPAAGQAAEALYLLDPTDPATVRHLVEARARQGSFQAAEAAFASYREGLDGSEPDAELVSLMRRVRDLKDQIAPGGRDEDPVPLVGRDEPLSRGREGLRRILGGSFEVVLIQGEPGIGKTRLLEELRREAHLMGCMCLHARPVELEQRIPLNPLIDAFRNTDVRPYIQGLDEPWRAVIASLLPEEIGVGPTAPVPPIQESSLSRRLLDSLFFLFESMASDQRIILFIDDLQWADATTVAALQFMQRRWRSGQMGVVASIRPEMISAQDEVAKYLSDQSDIEASNIELGDLPDSEALRLVQAVSAEEIDRDTARRIAALGGGNPFYIIELTKDFLAGRLEFPAIPSQTVAIPISLQQLFDARMEHLGAPALRTAAMLAVWARWISLGDLAALTDQSLDACADCVDELAEGRLVILDGNRVRIAHELFRSALYRQLTDARLAVLHLRVAKHLKATSEHPSDGELAVHYAKAGEAELAVRHARVAADEALEGGAMREAAYALELIVDNEVDDEKRARATAELARSLHLNREIVKAAPLLQLAAEHERRLGRHGSALRLEIRRVEALADLSAAPVPNLLDRLQDVIRAAKADDDWEAVALAADQQLHLLYRAGDVAGIRSLFRQLRSLASTIPARAACRLYGALALNVLFGDPDDGLRAAREAVAIAEQEGLHEHLLTAYNRLVVVLQYRAMLHHEEGQLLLAKARRAAETSGDLLQRFNLEANVGAFHLDVGQLDRAQAALQKAKSIIGDANADLPRIILAYNLGELAAQRQDYSIAMKHFCQAEQALSSSIPDSMEDLLNAGIGLCALELGAMSEARRRETNLRPRDDWHFDPTMIFAFRARILERRGRTADAIALLRKADRLESSLTAAWLKIRLLEAHLGKRRGISQPLGRLRHARAVAERLKLNLRVAQFDQVLASE